MTVPVIIKCPEPLESFGRYLFIQTLIGVFGPLETHVDEGYNTISLIYFDVKNESLSPLEWQSPGACNSFILASFHSFPHVLSKMFGTPTYTPKTRISDKNLLKLLAAQISHGNELYI
jgi:hypothetical protein